VVAVLLSLGVGGLLVILWVIDAVRT
jgi:hypothetical protein